MQGGIVPNMKLVLGDQFDFVPRWKSLPGTSVKVKIKKREKRYKSKLPHVRPLCIEMSIFFHACVGSMRFNSLLFS